MQEEAPRRETQPENKLEKLPWNTNTLSISSASSSSIKLPRNQQRNQQIDITWRELVKCRRKEPIKSQHKETHRRLKLANKAKYCANIQTFRCHRIQDENVQRTPTNVSTQKPSSEAKWHQRKRALYWLMKSMLTIADDMLQSGVRLESPFNHEAQTCITRCLRSVRIGAASS